MRKNIYFLSCIIFFSFCFTTFADIDDNTTQWQNLRDRIWVVQWTQVWLPTGVSEPKGRIWYILSNLFNSSGHIPNIALKAFSGSVRTNNNILKWRWWNGGWFWQSQLYDDGTTIWLWWAADAPSLQVDVTWAIWANQYCDGNGNNCFSPSTVSTSSGTVWGTGTAWYVTRFTWPSTIADSVMQDNGTNVWIWVAPSSDRLRVNGVARIDGWVSVDGRTAISGTNYSHTARSTANDRYGFFEVRRDDDTRGAYFGYGNGTDTVQLNLDNASYLSIGWGRVILGTEWTASNHLVTKGYVDTAVSWASSLWSVNGSEIYYNTANVGIGTNDPATTLDVSGDIRSGTVATNCVWNCPATAAPPVSGDWWVSGNLNVTGNTSATKVSIGTADTSHALVVNSSSDWLTAKFNSPGSWTAIKMRAWNTSVNTKWLYLHYGGTNSWDNNQVRFWWANPNDANMWWTWPNSVIFDLDAGNNTLFVGGNSNVWIWTSAPNHKLHVNWPARFQWWVRRYTDSSFDCTFGGEFTNNVNSFKFNLGNGVYKCIYMFYVGNAHSNEQDSIYVCPYYGLKDGNARRVGLAWKKDQSTWGNMWSYAVSVASSGEFKFYESIGDWGWNYGLGINMIYASSQPNRVHSQYGAGFWNSWQIPMTHNTQRSSYSANSFVVCEL